MSSQGGVISRRRALAAAGVFLVDAACQPEKLFAPQVKVPRKFFGHQLNGGLLLTPEAVDIPIGTYRVWNNGASYEWVYRNNWEGFDKALSFAESKKAEVLYVMLGEPRTPLPSMEKWKSFVSEAVSRAAGRIRAWEPINEAVYVGEPSEILDYASEAYRIIKSVQSDAIVTSPSLNDLTRPYAQKFAESYLALIGKSADVVAFHSYDAWSQLPHVIRWIREQTLLPIWNTETVGVQSLESQAEFGIERVVLNAQIDGQADYSSISPLGREYCAAFERLAA